MVNMLIKEAKFSCNMQNKFGITPLMMSMFAFDENKDHTPGLERFLLEQGANLRIQDEDKRTALFYLFFKHRQI